MSFLLLLSVFRSRDSQLARVAGSYDRLHRFSCIVLCSLRHLFLFNAIRRSCSRSALVFSRMSICSRSVSMVLGRPALGRPRCPYVHGDRPFGSWRTSLGLRAPPRPTVGCGRRGVHHTCAYLTAPTPFIQLLVAYPLWPVNPDE